MAPGIALIIGILIGAIIVYFLMQSKVKQKENALQQSRNRLEQLDREQEQRLSELTRQLEADYEQKLAEKIERYQDKHAQQMDDLESEYEARLAVLTGFEEISAAEEDLTADYIADSESLYTDPASDEAMVPSAATPPEYDQPEDPELGGAATATTGPTTLLPDPWDEQSGAAVTNPPESPSIPLTAPPRTSHEALTPSHQTLAAISETLATNRRSLAQALPILSKLGKDPDPTVRLAAVNLLKQVESIKAIPLLRQALRDPNSEVVAAATEALNRFKGIPKPANQTSNKGKKKLPKNR